MAVQQFDVGDRVRFTAELHNSAGALTDPGTLTGRSQLGAATPTAITPTKVSTGIYYIDATLSAAGTWKFGIYGTAGIVVAVEGYCKATSVFE